MNMFRAIISPILTNAESDICVTVHHWYNNVNSQLDAAVTIY